MSLSQACKLFGYSRQAYYKQKESALHLRQLVQQVKELVQGLRLKLPRLGTRKLYYLLQEQLRGLKVGRDKLFLILREAGLLVRPNKSYHKTTDSKHWMKKHRNLVEELLIERPEQVWVADMTYLPTREGHSYLWLVTDAYSKKIMGYHLSQDLRAQGPAEALKMAVSNNRYGYELIHHADRGVRRSTSSCWRRRR